jgi:hypothetical protein
MKEKNLSNTLPIEYNMPVIEDNKPAARWHVVINQALNNIDDADQLMPMSFRMSHHPVSMLWSVL